MFQHKYHTKIDDMIEKTSANMRVQLVAKLVSVLGKLSIFLSSSYVWIVLILLLSPDYSIFEFSCWSTPFLRRKSANVELKIQLKINVTYREDAG